MKGFSLLELLITISIVGTLSAICIPVYSQHIAHAKRVEAEITLQKLAVALEQYFTIHNSYSDADLQKLGFTENTNTRYQFVLSSMTNDGYVVSAIPSAKQAEKDLACETLSLNSIGEKKISGNGSIEDCW